MVFLDCLLLLAFLPYLTSLLLSAASLLLLLVNDVPGMSAVACIPSVDNSRAVACMRPYCFLSRNNFNMSLNIYRCPDLPINTVDFCAVVDIPSVPGMCFNRG